MKHSIARWRWHLLLIAFLLATSLALFFPTTSFAHAELLRSDPSDGATLRIAPTRVRLWFSEALNSSSTFSGAVVVDAANHSVDMHDAQVVSSDARELDVSLLSHLPAGNYIVAWHVVSEDDGHLTSGIISFTVTRADGSVPPAATSPSTQTNSFALNADSSSGSPLVSFIVVTLLELTAVFWVGMHLFQQFVLQSVTEEHEDLREMNSRIQRRFEHLAVVAVVFLLVANSGVLLEQVVAITGRNTTSAWDPSVWITAITSGRFGLFWLVRGLLLVLALRLAVVPFQVKHPPQGIAALLSWGNLLLGLALFLTMASTSHAAASTLVVYAVLADFVHLLAAALWIGGILFIGSCYLPTLQKYTPREQAHSLITTLPAYSPWAIVGVVLMALTGPFLATVRLQGWEQLFTTPYGEALSVKVLLVGILLLASALHTFWLRPRLKRAYSALPTLASKEALVDANAPLPAATLVKSSEQTVIRQVQWLRRILRFEASAGIGILVCVGLMNVLAGTVPPSQGASSGTSRGLPIATPGSPLHMTVASSAKTIRYPSQPHLYTLSPTNTGLMQPTVDVNGNVWVGEMNANRLARLNTRTGVVTTWVPPDAQNGIMTTAVDRRGVVWFVEQGANYIGSFDPAREVFRTFPLGVAHGHLLGPQALAFDASGKLWFTAPSGGQVGRLDPTTGVITTWDVSAPRGGTRSAPFSLTVTGDGQIWFGLLAGGAIGNLDPSSGRITLYLLPNAQTAVFSMAADSKDRIWWTELNTGRLGELDPATRTLLEVPVPAEPGGTLSSLYAMTVTRDGTIWFADNTANALVRYEPMTRTFTFFHFSSPSNAPYGLALDTRGFVWFTAASSSIVGEVTP